MEESIPHPCIHDHTMEDAPMKLQYISVGRRWNIYTYNVQLHRANATYWQCTVRPKGNRCRAIVIQRGHEFQQGKQNHNHPLAAGAATAARVMASVKEKAVDDQFKSASAIINEVSLKKYSCFCIDPHV